MVFQRLYYPFAKQEFSCFSPSVLCLSFQLRLYSFKRNLLVLYFMSYWRPLNIQLTVPTHVKLQAPWRQTFELPILTRGNTGYQ